MATNSLKSLHHHHHHHHSLSKRHSIDLPPHSSSFFLKPTTKPTSQGHNFTTFSMSPAASTAGAAVTAAGAATTATGAATTFGVLEQLLSTQNFREADEETRRLLIVLAGEAAKKRGYVFFSETRFIPESDMKAMDELWRKYSDNKFGYSVQRKIWRKADKDFTKFFIRVAWMKKLESSEVDQYNYRAFPNEFVWELNDETPDGHLPLTNALRGTQLLTSIFSHPAFVEDGEEEEGSEVKLQGSVEDKASVKKGGLFSGLKDKLFKTDYSF